MLAALDPNKAHAHDNVRIRMLKICGSSIYKPLEMIFKQCIETGVFPSEWKNANIVPIHKKGDKQTLENYRPVSLLPICEKILKRLMINEMFNFSLKINLFHRISPVLKLVILALTRCYLSLTRYMNLLMWDLKLEASSLICQKHLIKCDLQTKSKWNIVKFTKPSGRFFKGRKTTRSLQRTSLYMEKDQCWSSILGCFLFTLMILQKASQPM